MPDLSALLSVATPWILAVVTPGPNFLVVADGYRRCWIDRGAGACFVLFGAKLVVCR